MLDVVLRKGIDTYGKQLYPLLFAELTMPESKTINGITYSLEHLNSELVRDVPMTDFAGKEFKKPVFVIYSCHCYTKGEENGFVITAPAHEIIWDGKRRRQFCEERYGFSKVLPNVMQKLLFSPHAHVWETGIDRHTGKPRENRRYHELVVCPNTGSSVPYYIYMRIEKAQLANDGPRVIKMVVESAYPIHPPNPVPREEVSVPLPIWLGRTWAPPQPGAIKAKKKQKKK